MKIFSTFPRFLLLAIALAAACDDGPPGPPNPLPLRLEKVGGDEQADTVLATLPNRLQVRVMRGDTPEPGVTITWTASSGTLSAAQAVTDGLGEASVTWTLGAEIGPQTVSASVADAVGSPVVFAARVLPQAIVSDPEMSAAAPSGEVNRAASNLVTESVFVSMPTGSVPDGQLATIFNVRAQRVVQTPTVAGGFDPVGLEASPGDPLVIEVSVAGGGPPIRFLRSVPPRRRPVIVRTDPPPRKRDVPLNASLVIVFSEPIDESTVNSSTVQLRDGSTLVAGRLEFQDPSRLSATFVPETLLTGDTDYQLVVSQGIRDRDGELLETVANVGFRTTVLPPQPASQLAFTAPPTDGLATLSIAPVIEVTARNGAGERAIDFTGDISLTLEPNAGGATLSGVTTVAAVSGVARFSNVRVDQAGSSYVLRASASSLVSAISAPFSMVPAGRIAFTSTRDGNREIYVMNPDGSGLTRLTNDPSEDYQPAWSPDGSRIAFVSERDGNSEIYVMNSDGSGVTRLTNAPEPDGAPAWSPDGTRIAFEHGAFPWESPPGRGIHVMNADGSGVTRLTNGPHDTEPDWSPEGTRIAFTHELLDEFTPAQVHVMNADGSGNHALTSYQCCQFAESSPAWSPDGSRIAFWSFGFGIATINSDGSGETLTVFSDFEGGVFFGAGPDWSPDGKKLVFRRVSGLGIPEILMIDIDGSGLTALTSDGADAAWWPARLP